MKEDSASWYEQVRYRRERENEHSPRRMKLRARRSHVYSNAGGGGWARFRLVSDQISRLDAGVPSNGRKMGSLKSFRDAAPSNPVCRLVGSFRPALMSLYLRFL